MKVPTIKEKIYRKNKIYTKNIKARGQKLQISKKLSKKNEIVNSKDLIINNYAHYNKKYDLNLKTKFDKKIF